MSALLWHDGHLGWPFFVLVVFSLGCVLVFDLAWRLVNVRFALLGGLAAIVWGAGVTIILATAAI